MTPEEIKTKQVVISMRDLNFQGRAFFMSGFRKYNNILMLIKHHVFVYLNKRLPCLPLPEDLSRKAPFFKSYLDQ